VIGNGRFSSGPRATRHIVDDLRSQHELNSKIEALWVLGE
jgi:hypothetical protein